MEENQEARISSNGLKYLLYFPRDYRKDKKFPLMLFLHGSEERGNRLELVKRHGPPKIVETKDLPFIIISPLCPSRRYWMPNPLMETLNEVIQETNADKERIYGTGISMGGYGIWDLAIQFPETFAALAPVCGGGDESKVYRIKDVPTWVFHGAKDDTVPLSESATMVQELMKAGGMVTFTIYPDADHDSWTETYNNNKLFEWFLMHRKQKEKSAHF